PALTDKDLHRRLAGLGESGVTVGFSTSGPKQADAIREALAIEVGGAPLFRSIQSTWNILEPSAGPALEEARQRACFVIVKEALANGRLANIDREAIGVALAQPFVDIVLSGAATVEQLTSNLAATPEGPEEYWSRRSAMKWQ